ncbi:MAG: PHP domain-containing protein [Pygmaiobacter massiliensis]
MNYIIKDAPQYKANLHSHSTISDGKLSPEALAAAYRERGYSVLAITDHEAPWDHSALATPDFLLLTGYEAYIRPSAEGVFDPYGPEIHLNLLAKEPHNTTFICYDSAFCKYLSSVQAAAYPQAGQQGSRKYTREYIQYFIDTARANGYLVTYNHPCWSMEDIADILAYEGCFSLEIFNTSSQRISGHEANGALYDMLLRRNKFWYCHGSDDNHNKHPFKDLLSDSFGAWTMILAKELTYPAIIEALESGSFYASTGPAITALEICGQKAHLECSPAARVVMHQSLKRTKSCYDVGGGLITSADFEIPTDAAYVYFSVFSTNGQEAHTRAYRQEEFSVLE